MPKTKKKIVEVCYSNSLKINRGSYEQENPFYSAKSIMEENGTPIDETAEYARLRNIIDPILVQQYNDAKLDMSKLRVRVKDGKKYPSVTSITKPDPYTGDPEYGIRGTEIHLICNEFITTGKWRVPMEPLTKLKYEDIPYQAFFEKFKDRLDFKDAKLNIEVFNEKHIYSGEIDLVCPVDGVLSLVDLKTGGWDWIQLVAYFKAYGQVKQLAIFDFKNTELEILKLNDPKCVDKWETFLKKRGAFEARFGI